jgi:hypothetical protein
MKSYAKSSVVAIALFAMANVSIAHAAGAPVHHRHRQSPGGMQAKAMLMIKQISSTYGGETSLMSGNFNPTDFLSQIQRWSHALSFGLQIRRASPGGFLLEIYRSGLTASKLPLAKQKSSKSWADTVSPPVPKGTALRDEGCDVTSTGQNQDE